MFCEGKKTRKKFLLLLLLLLYFTVAYIAMNYYNITCVFLKVFGVPCPGCGMTRAVLSLIRLDFCGAFKHNVVVFFMPYVFMYVFFDFKHKIHNVLLSIIAVTAIINWVIKIAIFI